MQTKLGCASPWCNGSLITIWGCDGWDGSQNSPPFTFSSDRSQHRLWQTDRHRHTHHQIWGSPTQKALRAKIRTPPLKGQGHFRPEASAEVWYPDTNQHRYFCDNTIIGKLITEIKSFSALSVRKCSKHTESHERKPSSKVVFYIVFEFSLLESVRPLRQSPFLVLCWRGFPKIFKIWIISPKTAESGLLTPSELGEIRFWNSCFFFQKKKQNSGRKWLRPLRSQTAKFPGNLLTVQVFRQIWIFIF